MMTLSKKFNKSTKKRRKEKISNHLLHLKTKNQDLTKNQ